MSSFSNSSKELLMMPGKKNVLLVGTGAVGTIAALNLETGGRAAVTAVLRSNFSAVQEKGFTIKSCDHGLLDNWRPTKLVEKMPVASEEAPPFDYIVITTKNVPDHGPHILTQVASAISPGKTVIVLIQNGLNIEQPWFQSFPKNVVLSGISMIGSQETKPGVINHTSTDVLTIGAFRNVNVDAATEQNLAEEFVAMYAAAGKTSCTFSPDIQWHRWRKLVYNACFNPLCAITDLDSGTFQRSEGSVAALVVPAMQEIIAAAAASGHVFPDTIIESMISADPPELLFEPSMLQDARRLNFIEHETIIGEPLREGQRLGVAMPTISILYQLCKVLQWRILNRRKSA